MEWRENSHDPPPPLPRARPPLPPLCAPIPSRTRRRHASGRPRATPEAAQQPTCPGSRAGGARKRGAARKPAPPDLRRDPASVCAGTGRGTHYPFPHSHFRAKGARAGKVRPPIYPARHPLLPAPPAPVCAQRERGKVPRSHANSTQTGTARDKTPPFCPTPLLAREREGAQTRSGAPPLTSAQERRANGRGAEWEGVYATGCVRANGE
ncbi:hypothetical protein EDB85DRAFT_1924265 [Lactarius pseudohatsudake]|nr:hypothetical protein EDB85DRAFT_1924265 [Lactarius pseudohatsudake]